MPDIEKMINELEEKTDCDFKVALEVNKPKSWLKSVSAYANERGGTLIFGITNNKTVKGLKDIQTDIEIISRQIKQKITPLPSINFRTERTDDGRDVLFIDVEAGNDTPYFYSSDGNLIAFVRIGSESVVAPASRLRELMLKGKNLTFDALPTEYKVNDLTFTMLDATFKKEVKQTLSVNDYISFGLCKPDGILTNAGVMFSDECPLLQSRVFCTRWDGLDKGGGVDDAIDDKEFDGDLISQLQKSHDFVKLNMKNPWKKMPDHRINKPDYAERAVFEALANALMHRNYDIIGSEVHVDMYDDRLEIYSPGGMPDGTLVQDHDIENVPSTRRNPIIADIFHRLDFIERRGSGFKKIRRETSFLHGYTDEYAPVFRSTSTAFHVVFKNMNYDLRGITEQDNTQVTEQDNTQDGRTVAILEFCNIPRSRDEIQMHIGIVHREYFRASILKPLIDEGLLCMTIPDKPSSRNQKYVKA